LITSVRWERKQETSRLVPSIGIKLMGKGRRKGLNCRHSQIIVVGRKKGVGGTSRGAKLGDNGIPPKKETITRR